MRTLFSVCILLIFPSSWLQAQQAHPFANLQGWKQVTTEHFDVWYPFDLEEDAVLVARYAELARFELGILYDYKPESRFTLIYAPHEQVLLQSNLQFNPVDEAPGVVSIPRRYGVVVHPGSQQALFPEVKRTVSHTILQEFAYGNRIGSTTQARLLLYDADWFREGLSDYVADGWTFSDQQMMQQVAIGELMELAQEGHSELQRVIRKSIWHYIGHEYGEQKISEIIYLVYISNTIEDGIISVLGVNLSTLTSRWQAFVELHIQEQSKHRSQISEFAQSKEIPLKAGYQLAGAALDEGGNRIAMLLEKGGRYQLFFYYPEDERHELTSVKIGLSRTDAVHFGHHYPMAWSPNGEELAFPVYQDQQFQMGYYRPAEEAFTTASLGRNVTRVTRVSWAPNGKHLVISALKNGRSQLYLLSAGKGSLTPLTGGGYDDLDPSFTLDGQHILFASNRPNTDLTAVESYGSLYQANLDLFQLRLSPDNTPDSLVRLTQTPTIQERAPFAVSTDEVLFVSDDNGIHNLSKMGRLDDQRIILTDWGDGVESLVASDQLILVQHRTAGQATLHLMPTAAFQTAVYPEPTLLRLGYEAAFAARINAEAQQAAEAAKVEQAAAKEASSSEKSTAPPSETSPAPESKPTEPLRYYIFDEEEEPYEAKRPADLLFETAQKEPDNLLLTVFGKAPKPALADIDVSRGGRGPTAWQTDFMGLGLFFDPVSRLGLDFRLGLSDVFQNHRLDIHLQPAFNLRNGTHTIRYAYLPHRIDFEAQGQLYYRRLREDGLSVNDSLLFQYNQANIQLLARYPFTAHSSISLSVGYHFLDRRDLQLASRLRENALFNDRDHLARVGLELRHDNVQEREGFRMSGWEARLGADAFYSLTDNSLAFARIQGDVRHYKEVFKKIVLASRISGALNSPRATVQHYLGGVPGQLHRPVILQRRDAPAISNQITDTALYSIHFMNFVTPVRGFRYNTRNGSRFVAANLELRIPVTRLLRRSLSSRALYNLEVIPFLDAGTVWVEGNPFSQKKPTDTQYLNEGPLTIKLQTLKSPFLIGFGSGVKTRILGWTLRLDLAWGIDDYTLQRPMFTTSFAKNF